MANNNDEWVTEVQESAARLMADRSSGGATGAFRAMRYPQGSAHLSAVEIADVKANMDPEARSRALADAAAGISPRKDWRHVYNPTNSSPHYSQPDAHGSVSFQSLCRALRETALTLRSLGFLPPRSDKHDRDNPGNDPGMA